MRRLARKRVHWTEVVGHHVDSDRLVGGRGLNRVPIVHGISKAKIEQKVFRSQGLIFTFKQLSRTLTAKHFSLEPSHFIRFFTGLCNIIRTSFLHCLPYFSMMAEYFSIIIHFLIVTLSLVFD